MTEETKKAWFEHYDINKCLQPFKYQNQKLPCGTCKNCRKTYKEYQKKKGLIK